MSFGVETALLDSLSVDPVSPEAGELWFNASTLQLRFHDGSSTVSLITAPGKPVPYNVASLAIADGEYAIRVDPEVTGSNSISISGSGSLVVH
jgi:hypothetical protein